VGGGTDEEAENIFLLNSFAFSKKS